MVDALGRRFSEEHIAVELYVINLHQCLNIQLYFETVTAIKRNTLEMLVLYVCLEYFPRA
jgi:hypothetical protein